MYYIKPSVGDFLRKSTQHQGGLLFSGDYTYRRYTRSAQDRSQWRILIHSLGCQRAGTQSS